MAAKVLDFRFGVKRSDGYVSDVWKVWASREGDIYIAHRSMISIQKYSFHSSGICRYAFTKERCTTVRGGDRTMHKWNRAATPLNGQRSATKVAWIAFPTDFLSRPLTSYTKEIIWIDAAPAGGATYIECAYTMETEQTVEEAFQVIPGRKLVRYVRFPTGEGFFLSYYPADWENKDLTVVGNEYSSEILFSADDPQNTGRPIRILWGPNPKDGEAVLLKEMGGYVVVATQGNLI